MSKTKKHVIIFISLSWGHVSIVGINSKCYRKYLEDYNFIILFLRFYISKFPLVCVGYISCKILVIHFWWFIKKEKNTISNYQIPIYSIALKCFVLFRKHFFLELHLLAPLQFSPKISHWECLSNFKVQWLY